MRGSERHNTFPCTIDRIIKHPLSAVTNSPIADADKSAAAEVKGAVVVQRADYRNRQTIAAEILSASETVFLKKFTLLHWPCR